MSQKTSDTRSLAQERALFALLGLTLVWSFSEAIAFFVVADVIISLIALVYGWRAGALAVVFALVGAVLGGIISYQWGRADIDGARALFAHLPAISNITIARAQAEIAQGEYGLAMLKGSLTGVPYKLYASEAGASGASLWTFLALTPLVRAPRFIWAVVAMSIVCAFAPASVQAHRLKLLALFWLVFYALYWNLTPS